MAQWTDVDLVTASDDGVDVANQINNLRDAFTSGSSGATAPTNALPGMVYSKTVAGGFQPVMVTGAGTEVALGTVTTATGVFALPIEVIETALTGSGRGVPTGTVLMHAANSAPAGYLKANGAAVSRTTYAALFAAIGTTFGVGNGSTTFNLPDLRGEFLRGWDDGRGADTGRTFGSAQADELESHTHGFGGNDALVTPGSSASGLASGPLFVAGVEAKPITATGGAETRPRNVALLAIIKF